MLFFFGGVGRRKSQRDREFVAVLKEKKKLIKTRGNIVTYIATIAATTSSIKASITPLAIFPKKGLFFIKLNQKRDLLRWSKR